MRHTVEKIITRRRYFPSTNKHCLSFYPISPSSYIFHQINFECLIINRLTSEITIADSGSRAKVWQALDEEQTW